CLPSSGLARPPAGRSGRAGRDGGDRSDRLAGAPPPGSLYERPARATPPPRTQPRPEGPPVCRHIAPPGACPHSDEPVALMELYSDSTTTTGRSPTASIVTPTQAAPI